MARGVRVRALETRPELSDWQLFVFESFNTLSRDRQLGMGVGPIPWSSIDRFVQSRLERGWIEPDEAEDLEALICALDDDTMANRPKPGPDKPDPKGDQADD